MKTEENSLQLGESPENKIPGLPYSLADFEKGMTELSRLVKQEVAIERLVLDQIEPRLQNHEFHCLFPVNQLREFLGKSLDDLPGNFVTLVGFVLYALDKLETK